MNKLGQNFLINDGIRRLIVSTLGLCAGDVVIEIGPGHGELTDELRIISKKLRIIAIEKDKKLVEALKLKYKNDEKIKILEGDALKLLPSIIHDSKFPPKARLAGGGITHEYKIIGNIPYYITGHLFRILSELPVKPGLVVLTIQKEVAERLCALPPKMNLLAAATQAWAKIKIIKTVPKKNFRPVPKVDSAIILLEPIKNCSLPKEYFGLIRALFKQPRKTIANNLLILFPDRANLIRTLHSLKVDPGARPQNLSVDEIKKLSLLV